MYAVVHIVSRDYIKLQGSLNKFHGSHPLRERARKIHQGIIGVR